MKDFKFLVLTDPHFFDTDLGCSGPDYDDFMHYEQKCFAETESINKSVFEWLKNADEADTVLIAGDLSFNGEKKSHEKFIKLLYDIKAKGKEATKKELDVYENMLIFNEMMARGIEVLPIDLNKSHAMKYVPEDGKMRLPFGALGGVGEKAAYSIYEAAQKGNFVSIEDFQLEAGVSKTIIQNLAVCSTYFLRRSHILS